jgi:hypothetical protein
MISDHLFLLMQNQEEEEEAIMKWRIVMTDN